MTYRAVLSAPRIVIPESHTAAEQTASVSIDDSSPNEPTLAETPQDASTLPPPVTRDTSITPDPSSGDHVVKKRARTDDDDGTRSTNHSPTGNRGGGRGSKKKRM